MDQIFIVILNWNGKNDTLACLKSLEAIPTPHQVIVVDNGSTDDSVLAIQTAYPQITLLETGENLGYGGGNNVGIEHALNKGADALLILNNDTIVDPHILEGFLKQKAPIQGAKSYLYDDPQRLDHLGGMWNQDKGRFDLVGAGEKDGEKWEHPLSLDYVCGCALYAKAEVFYEIGGFEPRFFLFWEESDWCFRAKKKGYSLLTCPEAKLYHKVSASFRGSRPHTTYFWWRNRLLWIERNCSKKEKWSLFFKVLFPEISHLFKIYALQSLQLFLTQLFKPTYDTTTKEKRLKNNKAALTGIKDYLFRSFGQGQGARFQFGTKSPKCYKQAKKITS